jgi:hypothetical protein
VQATAAGLRSGPSRFLRPLVPTNGPGEQDSAESLARIGAVAARRGRGVTRAAVRAFWCACGKADTMLHVSVQASTEQQTPVGATV